MLEKELTFESNLFFFLNGSDSILADHFFWIYSYKWSWIPLYLCFLSVFMYRKNWKEIVCILGAVALVILLADQIASGFFKPMFQRFRPSHHPDFKDQVDLVFNYKGGGKYGFISSHAANAFGFATFMALLFRNKWFTWTMMIFAFVNGYSRIYLGAHFISDVVVGTVVGLTTGYLVYELYLLARRSWLKVPTDELRKSLFTTKQIYFLCSAYLASVLIFLLFHNQLVALLHK